MELKIPSIRRIARLSEKAQGIHDLFSEALDGQKAILPSVNATLPASFSVADDFGSLKDEVELLLRENSNLTVEQIFFTLKKYFEAGFLFATDHQTMTGKLLAVYLRGETHRLSRSEQKQSGLPIPFDYEFGVRRGRARPVFKGVGAAMPNELNDADAFLFSPFPGFALILICRRAAPWQMDAVEHAFHAMQAGFKSAVKNRRGTR